MKTYLELVEAQLDERYTANNSYFLQYMKGGDEFDPYAYWHMITSWIIENYPDETNEAAGKEVTWDDLSNWYEPDFFYKLPDYVQKECAESILATAMEYEASEAPTTSHMTLMGNKMMKRSSWLIHYSDHAYDISLNGFKYGVDEMDKLGLTTWFGDDRKKYGGYNFAFDAARRDALNAEGKYGKEAVIFRNAGVRCDHHGDSEEQIVFWGADVDPKDIIYLSCEYGTWGVARKYGDGDPVFKSDELEKVIKWVMQHSDRYRKAIGIR